AASQNAKRFADPQRAAAEARTARWAEFDLASCERQLKDMRVQGIDPDTWLAAHGDALLRRQVYAREHRIRREMDVLQGAERSVVEPSEHVLARLGAAPKTGTP